MILTPEREKDIEKLLHANLRRENDPPHPIF